jgi:tripartite-type tricarboxylate transporter receptor subunit TctC
MPIIVVSHTLERKREFEMRKLICRGFVAGFATLIATISYAQDYPHKTIKAVVPYGAGQATDMMCRVFLDSLKTVLKQPIVIENRPGAGSNIGAAEAAKSTPDGYTVLCTGNATHVGNPFLYSTMGFDAEKDLVPVNVVAGTVFVLMVNNKDKGKTLKDLIATAKSASKQLTVGLASTSAQVVNGMLRDAAKVEFVRVPYAAGNQGLFPDLMRGDTDVVIEALPSAIARIKSEQVTALAQTGSKRSPFLPDVPTFKEAGFDVLLEGWNAFYVPKGTPPEIVKTLNGAANVALKDPEVAKRLETVASVPVGGTADELMSLIQTDRAKWGKVIKELDLKAN